MGDDDEQTDEPMLPSSLCKVVPNLGEDQALAICTAAYILKELDERPSDSLTDATMKIQGIDARLRVMQDHLSRFIEVQSMHQSTSRMHSVHGVIEHFPSVVL